MRKISSHKSWCSKLLANIQYTISNSERKHTFSFVRSWEMWQTCGLIPFYSDLHLAETEDTFILKTRKQTTLDGSSLKCKHSIISHVNGSRQYLSSSDSMKVKLLPSAKHWCWASSHAGVMTSILILVSSIFNCRKVLFLREREINAFKTA